MTDTITTALIAIVATIVALYLIGAWINRRADKQARRDKQHHDTALQIANGVKQRRATATPGPALGTLLNVNGEGIVPLNGVLVTRAIDTDGKDVFHIQWSNHMAQDDNLDTGDQLALAGALAQAAMCQSVVFKHDD